MSAKKSDPFGNADKTTNEVTVRAGLEGSGVSLKAKSRAISDFDRLIGAAFDIPGVWFSRRAERARIIAITEQESLKIDAKAFLSARETSSVNGSRPTPIWIEDLSKRIGNRAEVASYAIENLRDAASFADDGNGETSGTSDTYNASEMEDWMNAFIHRAEMASSEAMRSMLGRILSGEVLSPGSFSVATLRIVTELDQKSAGLFQNLCLSRFQQRHLLKKDKDIQGDRMYELYDLEERGLIKEVGGNVALRLEKQDDNYYYFKEGDTAIRFVIEPIGEYIQVSNIINTLLLTNTGYQLAQLLPYSQEAALNSIADEFAARDAVKEIDLFQITSEGGTHLKSIKGRNAE